MSVCLKVPRHTRPSDDEMRNCCRRAYPPGNGFPFGEGTLNAVNPHSGICDAGIRANESRFRGERLWKTLGQNAFAKNMDDRAHPAATHTRASPGSRRLYAKNRVPREAPSNPYPHFFFFASLPTSNMGKSIGRARFPRCIAASAPPTSKAVILERFTQIWAPISCQATMPGRAGHQRYPILGCREFQPGEPAEQPSNRGFGPVSTPGKNPVSGAPGTSPARNPDAVARSALSRAWRRKTRRWPARIKPARHQRRRVPLDHRPTTDAHLRPSRPARIAAP